jgi:hypothetical protein
MLYPEILYLTNEGDTKIFLDHQKLREFITMMPTLQEMLKGVLQDEEK